MLGDAVEVALRAVGVTPERVSRWLGRPCGCEARKRKLNALTGWLKQRAPAEHLLELMDETPEDGSRDCR